MRVNEILQQFILTENLYHEMGSQSFPVVSELTFCISLFTATRHNGTIAREFRKIEGKEFSRMYRLGEVKVPKCINLLFKMNNWN